MPPAAECRNQILPTGRRVLNMGETFYAGYNPNFMGDLAPVQAVFRIRAVVLRLRPMASD